MAAPRFLSCDVSVTFGSWERFPYKNWHWHQEQPSLFCGFDRPLDLHVALTLLLLLRHNSLLDAPRELRDGYFSIETWAFHRKYFGSRTELFSRRDPVFWNLHSMEDVNMMLQWLQPRHLSHIAVQLWITLFLVVRFSAALWVTWQHVTGCVRLWIQVCLCYLNCPRRRHLLNMRGDMSLCHRKTQLVVALLFFLSI